MESVRKELRVEKSEKSRATLTQVYNSKGYSSLFDIAKQNICKEVRRFDREEKLM